MYILINGDGVRQRRQTLEEKKTFYRSAIRLLLTDIRMETCFVSKRLYLFYYVSFFGRFVIVRF